eukprot:1840348-Amphidinium_carterae.1
MPQQQESASPGRGISGSLFVRPRTRNIVRFEVEKFLGQFQTSCVRNAMVKETVMVVSPR